MGNSKELTARQENFCQYVAQGKTYADAYRNSYPSSKKWKNEAVWVKSSELMTKGKVKVRIEELKRDTVKRNEVTIDQVLEQLANWLLFDPLDITDEENDTVKRLVDMDKKARMSLAEIHVQEIWGMKLGDDGKMHKTKTGELKKIKFIDKRAVSEQFMKKFGQYVNEDNSVSSNLEAIRELIKEVKK